MARIAFEWESTSLDSQGLAGEEMIAKGHELVETANAAKVLAAESARANRKFAELGHSMLGIQMNDVFSRASEAADAATSGVKDLNAALSGCGSPDDE